jgi:hypothetical protein
MHAWEERLRWHESGDCSSEFAGSPVSIPGLEEEPHSGQCSGCVTVF